MQQQQPQQQPPMNFNQMNFGMMQQQQPQMSSQHMPSQPQQQNFQLFSGAAQQQHNQGHQHQGQQGGHICPHCNKPRQQQGAGQGGNGGFPQQSFQPQAQGNNGMPSGMGMGSMRQPPPVPQPPQSMGHQAAQPQRMQSMYDMQQMQQRAGGMGGMNAQPGQAPMMSQYPGNDMQFGSNMMQQMQQKPMQQMQPNNMNWGMDSSGFAGNPSAGLSPMRGMNNQQQQNMYGGAPGVGIYGSPVRNQQQQPQPNPHMFGNMMQSSGMGMPMQQQQQPQGMQQQMGMNNMYAGLNGNISPMRGRPQ